MSSVKDILQERFKKTEKESKVQALAKQSRDGNLSSFSGFFGTCTLSENEKNQLSILLQSSITRSDQAYDVDVKDLISISQEIKSIDSQAILLHGERIRKAQSILKTYKEGTFTKWLLMAYGNRQTPYNFLMYYEFYMQLAPDLKTKLEVLPKQVVYSLASRNVSLEKKTEFISTISGKSKDEILAELRTCFPLSERDLRKENPIEKCLQYLIQAKAFYTRKKQEISQDSKKELENALLQFLKQLRID